jgi:2-C-methyl-D-erythritol 2,4-cyclodiphosphate synthase
VIEEFKPPDYSVGIGTDIHRIVEGRRLMLGGVHIPFPAGLLGHSDGDVALHAVVDALLGAAGMGDIGTLFPDTDVQWKDADSKAFLYSVREQLEKKQWEVVNVDLTIHTEAPSSGR